MSVSLLEKARSEYVPFLNPETFSENPVCPAEDMRYPISLNLQLVNLYYDFIR